MKKYILITATIILSFIQINAYGNDTLTFATQNGKTLYQPITPDMDDQEIPFFVKNGIVKQIEITELIKPEKKEDIPLYVKNLITKIKKNDLLKMEMLGWAYKR